MLAFGQIARPSCEQLKPVRKPRQHRARRQELHARSGQLDRQRETVQPGANLRDDCRVLLRQLDIGPNRLSTLEKESDRRIPCQFGKLREPLGIGCRQWRKWKLALAPNVEHQPACDQCFDFAAGAEQSRQRGRRLGHLLKVVEHEENASIPERVAEPDIDRQIAILADADRSGNRRKHAGGIDNIGERDERDCFKPLADLVRNFERKTRLSGSARTTERHDAHIGSLDHRGDLFELMLPADQRGEWSRKCAVDLLGHRVGACPIMSERRFRFRNACDLGLHDDRSRTLRQMWANHGDRQTVHAMIPPGEIAIMADSFDSNHLSSELLSFGEAGRLTGKPKAYLKELAESGHLSVRLQPANGESKLRVTRSGLAEAGLLHTDFDIALPDRGDVGELIALVREQASRISALEEQRFQLGAQLGAAIERVASLEDQVSELVQSSDIENSTIEAISAEANGHGHSVSAFRSLVEARARNVRLPNPIRARLASSRFHLPSRREH